jgi:hypothetical protein
MKPYQERVVEEKKELDARIEKLRYFIHANDDYAGLPKEEKARLNEQLDLMARYSEILGERRKNFV